MPLGLSQRVPSLDRPSSPFRVSFPGRDRGDNREARRRRRGARGAGARHATQGALQRISTSGAVSTNQTGIIDLSGLGRVNHSANQDSGFGEPSPVFPPRVNTEQGGVFVIEKVVLALEMSCSRG